MTIHSFPAKGTTKEESPVSEPSSKQTHTLSNYLTGQSPVIELPLHLPPRLVTVAFTSTSEILKQYFGGERPSRPPQDTSDPRVFSCTNSSAVSSTHSLQTNDSGYVSTSQSQSVMTSLIQNQSRDQITKELKQQYDFLITLREAQKGFSEAQFSLGLAYYQGQGEKKDYAQAVYWFSKAAEQGHATAQCNLGCAYAYGFGVKQDDAQAVYWFHKTADQGNADAQFNLGYAYLKGLGVKQDDVQAVDWYRKAAKQGLADAQFFVGCAYDRGEGVKEDKSEAFVWFRKVAEQGHAVAQFQIGTMYANGIGVEANDIEAFNWYFKAAGNGSVYAQLKLASHYQQGLGVKKDVLQATYWFLKSVVDGIGMEIFLDGDDVAEDFYSDVIQCIPVALTTFPEFKYKKTISFQKIDLSDQDFWSIGEMIRSNSHLEGLNLKYQIINNDNAQILSQSLAFNTTLTALIFDDFDDEYGFDINIFNEIKASLAQNVVIAELRKHMKENKITRSNELPLEVLDIIVDDMVVAASKGGRDIEGNRIEPTSKEATIAAIDEFLKRVSQ